MSRNIRGFTLTELLYASVLSSLLVGATTSLLYFVSRRIGVDAATSAATLQATSIAEDMSQNISLSTVCYAYPAANFATSGHTVLDCVQPLTGSSKSGGAIFDSVSPDAIAADGSESYNAGSHVTFFFSDGTGTLFNSAGYRDGTQFWRAVGPGGNQLPDSDWSQVAGNSRWPLLENITVRNDPLSRSTSFTITTSSLNRRFAPATATERGQEAARVSMTRTVFWRSSP